MADIRNALAELAERLGEITSAWRPSEPTGQYAIQSISYVRKARRIIAELAKVQEMERMLSEEDEYKDMPINVEMGIIQSYQTNCINKCRVIAEE